MTRSDDDSEKIGGHTGSRHPGCRCLSEFGLDSTWDPDDREACRSHHRGLYRSLKERYGGMGTPVEEIPGFVPSLQRLLNLGYSYTDVGVMLGVTRERVRQWAERFDLDRPYVHGSLYRVWDDAKNRFVPVSHGEMYRIAHDRHVRRARRTRARVRRRRREFHVAAVRKLEAELDRPPSRADVAEAVGEPWPAIAEVWQLHPVESGPHGTSAGNAFRALREAAGVGAENGAAMNPP